MYFKLLVEIKIFKKIDKLYFYKHLKKINTNINKVINEIKINFIEISCRTLDESLSIMDYDT